ncbi:hypothetical protein ACVIYH_009052 [Bradyrhizobium diazoefficiens]
MRISGFGDHYCHTAAEAQRLIDNCDDEPYLPSYPPDPPEGEFGATIEIAESGSGQSICWIEAPTVEAVDKILRELRIAP